MKRMEWFANTFLEESSCYSVLDVGSYNVNGTYKGLFKGERFSYSGLDMEEGPNVDIVPASTYKWDEIEDDTYDVVISGQALEHVEFFWLTVAEMVRVTKKDGLICIIAPNGFGEHRYPVDCWRFFTDGMIALARYNKLEIIHAHTNRGPAADEHDWFSEEFADSMLVAKKRYCGKAQQIEPHTYKCIPASHEEITMGLISYDEYKSENKQKKIKTEEVKEPQTRTSDDNHKETRLRKLIKKAKIAIRTHLKQKK